MERETLINTLKLSLTGNRPEDREKVFQFAENVDFDDQNSELLSYLRFAYAYIPSSLKDVDKAEFERHEHLLIKLILNIVNLLEEIPLVRRLDLLSYIIEYVESRDPRIKVTDTAIFDFSTYFERVLFESISNVPTEIDEAIYPYAHIYLTFGDKLAEFGDSRGAIEAYAKANRWNPISTAILQRLCGYFYHIKDSAELKRIATWMLKISFEGSDIATAMQFIGYALYLDGKFEQAYAYYFVSLKYSDVKSKGLNEEISAILTALGKDEPYNLTNRQIKDLFLGQKETPTTNPLIFSILRKYIIENFNEKDYTEVIEYAPDYLLVNSWDKKINSIFEQSKKLLN